MSMTPSDVVKSALLNGDQSRQLWAINLLPMTPKDNANNNISNCFKFLYLSFSKQCCPLGEHICAAMLRECEKRVLSDEDLYKYIFPFVVNKIASGSTDIEWFRLMKRFARSIKVRDIQHCLESDSVRFIHSFQKRASDCGAMIAKGLIKNGYIYSKQALEMIIPKHYPMRLLLKPLVLMLESCNFNQQFITELIKSAKPSHSTVEAILVMDSPNPILMEYIKDVISIKPPAPSLLLTYAKYYDKVVKYNILSLEEIVDYILEQQLFSPENAKILSRFFKRIIEINSVKIPHEKLLNFFNDFYKKNVIEALEMADFVVKRKRELEDLVVILFCSEISISNFSVWCRKYPVFYDSLQKISNRKQMENFLQKHLNNELNVGHKTRENGQKEFLRATSSIKKNVSFSDDFTNVTELEENLSKSGVSGSIECRCWREASMMLLLLQPNAETIPYLFKAIDIHGKALTSTLATVLAKFDDKTIISFLNEISQENSTHQIICVNIIYEILKSKSHLTLVSDFISLLSSIVFNEKTLSIVRCCVIRQFNILIYYVHSIKDRDLVKNAISRFSQFSKDPAVEDAIRSNSSSVPLMRAPSGVTAFTFSFNQKLSMPMTRANSITLSTSKPRYIVPKVNSIRKKNNIVRPSLNHTALM
ncbi:hypothetical protein TRFO_28717 [Tritrichomonas foetus]|uniref:Uncharacterized protein n=1 Tax=Tritrichomonas foetus TaxID=1144522 RepID=A0A1J4JXQ8_9EUKA|nr:hypothetical protein TRFO_28717 [Tritrichomonas foetus]|eukprot:OHT03935.1 hypothetical protein TRFO_28717 [Tritrichomonas foetus]